GWNGETNRLMRLSVDALARVAEQGHLDKLAAIVQKYTFTSEFSEAFVWARLASAAETPLRDSSVEHLWSALTPLKVRLRVQDDQDTLEELLPQLARLGYPDKAVQLARSVYHPLPPRVVGALARELPQDAQSAFLKQELS